MVRLGRGEIETRTATLFAEIVRSLPDDPELDRDDALCVLLLTQAHIVIRFNQCCRFLAQLWKLTNKFNPVGYAAEIFDALHWGNRLLDGGYSLLLKHEAWSAGQGVEADAVGHIMSEGVHVELVGRQDKRSETTRVTG